MRNSNLLHKAAMGALVAAALVVGVDQAVAEGVFQMPEGETVGDATFKKHARRGPRRGPRERSSAKSPASGFRLWILDADGTYPDLIILPASLNPRKD